MELWQAALEEVALSGLEGCTLEELWRHLSTHHPSQMTLDDTSKAFLWRSFLRPGQKEVQFFELPEDRPLPPLEEGKPSTTLPHRYSPVCDRESGVVGSCTTYNTRQDCTAHLKENTPSLQEAEQRYGQRLVLVGLPALRESVLLLHKTVDPVITMDTQWYCVLELVASFRGHGVLRSSVSHGYFSCGDTRKTWHIVKRFKEMGLLVCKEVTTKHPSKKHRGLSSSEHRVYHIRFAHLVGLESHDLQPTSLEEGEGAEGPPMSSESARRPVVGELPLDYQIYQMVESAGARGVSTVEFRNQGLRLPINWLSSFIKTVPSMPQYLMTTMDGCVSKTYRIIAKKHAHQNAEVKSLLRLGERKSPFVLKEEPTTVSTNVVEPQSDVSMATEGAEGGTPVGDDSDVVSLIDSKALLNVRQQRRRQMVLDFFNERPTVMMDNPQILRIYIAEKERTEGSSKLIDRKTVHRLISDLVKSGHLKTLTLHLEGLAVAEEGRKEVQVYTLTDTPDDVLEKHVESLKNFYASRKLKAEKKAVAEAEIASTSGSEGEEEEWEEEEGEESDAGEPSGEQPTRMLTSRFQKLRHLHIYLWLLSNGCSEAEVCQLSSILPPAQYPWVPHMVAEAKPLGSGRGSVTYKDVVDDLPLSALLMLFGVQKYSKRPQSVKNYLKNPEHQGVQFSRLPSKIRSVLSHGTTSLSLLSYKMAAMLTQLRDMGLLELSVHCLTSKTKELATISLNSEVSFLDTTKCAPRRCFFLESARPSFPTVTLPLRSLSDLLHCWFQLNQVCTSTPILIKGVYKAVEGDVHPLPWIPGKKSLCEQAYYDKQGFGAGGFPPSLFAHLARNWTTFLKPVGGSGGGVRASLHHSEEDVNGESPSVVEDSPTGTLLGTVVHGGDCIKVIEVPKAAISQGKGGRGLKRRSSRLDDGETPAKKSKTDLPHGGDAGGTYSARKKFNWRAEEDALLLMARVALRVLQRLRCPEPQGAEMLQSLQEEFGLSMSKDLSSVKRRMQALARTRSFQTTVGTLAEEFLQDTKQQGETGDGKAITFSNVVSVLKTKHCVLPSSAQEPCSSVLPHTVQEFYAMYNVIDPQEDLKDTPPVPSIDNMADLHRSLLMDIIYCVLLSDLPYQEMYLAYKVFEAFPESDLQATFGLLRDRFLLKRKRTYNVGVLTRQGIHETGRYLISSSVRSTLFGSTPPQFRADLSGLLDRLALLHSGDVPVSDEGAEPTREVESQLEVARPKEACPHLVSMDCSEIDAAQLTVLLNAVAGLVGGWAGGGTGGGIHEASVESVEMKLPSHFFNGFEKLVHPIATGNSAEEMMESDGESEGECEGGDVMQQAEKAAGPLLVGQLQFYIPEYTKLNFSDIELSPSCLTGWLLDPTEDEGREQWAGLSDSPVTKGMELSDDPVSEDVLRAVCSDLGMCERDVATALDILRDVRGAGALGRPVNDVKKDVLLSREVPQKLLEDIVQVLLNLGMLHAVGTTDWRLVAAEHSAPWHTANSILAASSSESSFPCDNQFQIWSNLSGTGHINEQALQGMKETLCQEVNRRPGVTLVTLKEHFCGSLQPAALMDLLQLLVAEDCITAHHTTPQMDSSNLFSKPVVQIPATEAQFHDRSYFEPTLNNDIFLATFNNTK